MSFEQKFKIFDVLIYTGYTGTTDEMDGDYSVNIDDITIIESGTYEDMIDSVDKETMAQLKQKFNQNKKTVENILLCIIEMIKLK